MARFTLPPIELLRELFSYDPDTGYLYWKERSPEHFSRPCMKATWNRQNAGRQVTSIGGNRYIRVRIYKADFVAHRVIFALMTGKEPTNEIDHINGIRTDNRWCNLREATRSENSVNAGPMKNNALGIRGVCLFKQGKYIRYTAEICMNGKRRRLGYFSTPEEAEAAYRKAADEMHGEFAHHRSAN